MRPPRPAGRAQQRSATVGRMHGSVIRSATGMAVVALTALSALGGCSSDAGDDTSTVTDPTVVPDPTALAPGSCDPSEAVDAPSIDVGGTVTLATLGLADIGCSGTNGDGYISFNYNPVLIEGDGDVTITVADGVGAVLAWDGSTPFSEIEPGRWTTTLDPTSCSRVTIQLTSASGSSTATYGADIRSGGESVECPQRTIDPSDVPDESAGTLAPPPTDPPRTTTPPTSRPPTSSTTAATTTSASATTATTALDG